MFGVYSSDATSLQCRQVPTNPRRPEEYATPAKAFDVLFPSRAGACLSIMIAPRSVLPQERAEGVESSELATGGVDGGTWNRAASVPGGFIT